MHASDTPRARRAALALAGLGIASHVAAVLVAASRTSGFIGGSHPVAVLGADGVPGATAFNLFAFVVPGVCAALCAWWLRAAFDPHAPWPLRIGAHMLLLAGLAFAAQGVWPLDLDELDGGRSRGHATAWMLWAVSAIAGGLAVSIGLAMQRDMRIAAACATATLLVLAAAAGWIALDAGHAQRVGVAAWGVLAVLPAASRHVR